MTIEGQGIGEGRGRQKISAPKRKKGLASPPFKTKNIGREGGREKRRRGGGEEKELSYLS